jgi:ribosome maturation factor RimP
MGDVGERLWETLEPYLEAEGVELDDLDVRGRGNGRLVRVTVDAPGGLGVDRIAQLSRGVARLLDEQDPVSGSYTLEVSSPGLERPLRRASHFEKSVGREVDVKTVEPIDGAQRHRGVLERIDDAVLSVVVDGAERAIPMDSVAQAKTVFRWEKSPKPGGKRGKR